MSLVSSIQLANNALRATQIGLQVVGQNIANANTPGYVREEALLSPAPTQRVGSLRLGLGVEVKGVVQRIDRFLEDRLRGASSDRASSDMQEATFQELETLLGELGETDLSTSLDRFFASIQEVLNQPESLTIRNLAVLQGQTVASDINRLAAGAEKLRADRNREIEAVAGQINRLTDDIARLNNKIAEMEGSDLTGGEAVGLRDQRSIALKELAELVNIRVVEQPNSAVNVYVGSDYVVFGGDRRAVEVDYSANSGAGDVNIVETDSRLEVSGGKLGGLYVSRDEVVGGFVARLDEFARSFAFEFNRVFTSGQGIHGYRAIESQAQIADADAPLDAAGLAYTPANGAFQVQVLDRQTNQTTTTDIRVRLAGLDDDTTLEDVAAALDAVDGISASVNAGRLEIASDAPNVEFAFAADTSGILAALGVGTFFTGTSAVDIAVNQAVIDEPGLFAASTSGIGGDTTNAVLLGGFLDRPLETGNGATLAELYDQLAGATIESSSAASAVAEGLRVFEESLEGRHLAITGVNLDEEAVRLLTYQRAFQAASKYIATLNELLGILVNL